jgi:hypothetical protein
MDPKPSGWAVLFVMVWEFGLKDYFGSFFKRPGLYHPPDDRATQAEIETLQKRGYRTQKEFTKLHRPPIQEYNQEPHSEGKIPIRDRFSGPH